MAFRTDSRFRNSYETIDDDGLTFVAEADPFEYEDLPDNAVHQVAEGETWHSIAGDRFAALLRQPEAARFSQRLKPSGLFWIIMDFQPVPYLDPYTPPAPGTELFVPSVRTVIERIFDSDRQRLA